MATRHGPLNVSEPLQIIHLYAVGFLIEGRDAHGAAQNPAGSGVLVELDGLKGVLTAAHVARELARAEMIAIFSAAGPTSQKAQQLRFPGSAIRCVTAGDKDAPEGPDLGFVRFPYDIEQQLPVRHVYYNFQRRWDTAAADTPLVGYVITGAVGEKARLKRVEGALRVDERTMDLATGEVVSERVGGDGYDIFDFEIHHDEVVRRPTSYQGLSGAAVWRIGETRGVQDRLILGIAFYETDRPDGTKLITCHGPEGIYGRFAEAIRAARAAGKLD